MGSSTVSQMQQVPVIDFSRLDPANPGSERWIAVRAEVMQALELYSCLEAVDDEITPELREAVFGGVMKETFGLPLEVKLRNNTDRPFHGYVGGMPGMDYESLAIHEPARPEEVKRFVDLMWPQGNHNFCERICSFAKVLSKLDRMVRMMVLESLGVDKFFDSLVGTSVYSLRLSKYGDGATPHHHADHQEEEESKISMPAHTDPNMISIVCQHQVEGLQILTEDGKWIVPSKDSVTLMIADAFGAWTNGRLEPCSHRVTSKGNGTRYSTVFGAHPKDGYIAQVPEELVSEEHPLQYKPYNYDDYIQFRFSGKQANCTLKAYCGVESQEMET